MCYLQVQYWDGGKAWIPQDSMGIQKRHLMIRFSQQLPMDKLVNWVDNYLKYNEEFEGTFVVLSNQVEGTKRNKFNVEIPIINRCS